MMADKQKVSRLLKTARGQIDGILKMVEEDRYCVDISNQIMAAQSVLKKANGEVLKAHLDHCVKEAITENSAAEKLQEIHKIIEKGTENQSDFEKKIGSFFGLKSGEDYAEFMKIFCTESSLNYFNNHRIKENE